ncbi:MAG: MoaD/ThiS family protein [Candidatus Hydrogenedentes bacterium]|nr:MoaD/ThiS family protein [Candidatus Hydrogenedentota bacterium]
MKTVNVAYYAKLREERGCSEETLKSEAETPAALYEALRSAFGFTLRPAQLGVAVNEAFAPWDTTLKDGDTVVFIPPVAGG